MSMCESYYFNEEHIICSPLFVNWDTLDVAELKPLLCSLVKVKDKGYERYASCMLLIVVCAFVF